MPNRLLGIEFTSAELTTTGTGLTAAHGLGRTPKKAWIEITEQNGAATGTTSESIITATDATNITYSIEATAGSVTKYIIHAIL